MSDYDKLLEKGMSEVPDEVGSGSRFEVPDVKSRKEGSKTVVENFSDIADKFSREYKHVSNFIQNELGTAGQIKNGELILNGEFRRGKVQAKIEKYADEYLFCPECESPDTKIFKEKGVEILKCQACGARNPL